MSVLRVTKIMMTKITENIIKVDNFLNEEESLRYIDLANEKGFTLATINTKEGQVENTSVRNNSRCTYDSDELSNELWEKMKEYLPNTFNGRIADRLNNRLQIYRYEAGERFNWHLDGFYSPDPFTTSYFTFLVYLNDNFGGGGTSFKDIKFEDGKKDLTIEAKQGTALFFYHRLKHRGDEITKGVKYAMRSDVMYSSSLGK